MSHFQVYYRVNKAIRMAEVQAANAEKAEAKIFARDEVEAVTAVHEIARPFPALLADFSCAAPKPLDLDLSPTLTQGGE